MRGEPGYPIGASRVGRTGCLRIVLPYADQSSAPKRLGSGTRVRSARPKRTLASSIDRLIAGGPWGLSRLKDEVLGSDG